MKFLKTDLTGCKKKNMNHTPGAVTDVTLTSSLPSIVKIMIIHKWKNLYIYEDKFRRHNSTTDMFKEKHRAGFVNVRFLSYPLSSQYSAAFLDKHFS